MEVVKMLLETLQAINVDPVIVLLVLIGGSGARVYLKGFTRVCVWRWRLPVSAPFKTLLVGTFLTAIYVYLSYKEGGTVERTKVFYSYSLATCLYPFIKRPFNQVMVAVFDKINSVIPKKALPPEFEEPERPGYPPQTKQVNQTDMP